MDAKITGDLCAFAVGCTHPCRLPSASRLPAVGLSSLVLRVVVGRDCLMPSIGRLWHKRSLSSYLSIRLVPVQPVATFSLITTTSIVPCLRVAGLAVYHQSLARVPTQTTKIQAPIVAATNISFLLLNPLYFLVLPWPASCMASWFFYRPQRSVP